MARYGVWSPIPMWVGNTQKWIVGTNGRRRTAVVIHRMEGSLEGSDTYLKREFADYYPYPRLRASTHFGVGLWNGVPQIRQWVDTANTAWGWNARPSDVPTPLAKATITNLYTSTEDLNWQVISVEVEGFATNAWDYRTTAKVKELLAWIYRTHGNLVIMAHTDLSPKACPGMTTFKAALPGYYGNRLGNIFGGTTSNTSTTTPTTTTLKGFTVTMPFVSRTGWHGTIIKGKPIRSFYNSTALDPKFGRILADTGFQIWGEVKGASAGGSTRWFFGPLYTAGAWRIVFIPLVDLKARNF